MASERERNDGDAFAAIIGLAWIMIMTVLAFNAMRSLDKIGDALDRAYPAQPPTPDAGRGA